MELRCQSTVRALRNSCWPTSALVSPPGDQAQHVDLPGGQSAAGGRRPGAGPDGLSSSAYATAWSVPIRRPSVHAVGPRRRVQAVPRGGQLGLVVEHRPAARVRCAP